MGNIIGYTMGVFNLFHIGHLNILRKSKLQCDYLIVGVTTDELSESHKGKKPVIPFNERLEIVSSIRFVDEVIPQTNMNKFEAWEKLKFNKIFVGDDKKGTDMWNLFEKGFAKFDVEVVYFPYTAHTSSTKLRETLGILCGNPSY